MQASYIISIIKDSFMRKAVWNDKKKVIEIIVTAFCDNQGVNWVLKKEKNNNKKYLSRLATFAFIKAYNRNGIFISSNEKGVALYYKANNHRFFIREILYQVYFAFTSIKLHRLCKVVQRESFRRSQRPRSGEYLYCWFLGVLPGGNGAGFELKNALFREATQQQIPIYLETSDERNQLVYERIGFKTYYKWIDEKEQINFWFMKWEPMP